MKTHDTLGNRMRLRREELGLTQTELGSLVAMTQQSIASIEKGETRNPRKLLELSSALGCSPNWLKTGENESNATFNNGIELWSNETLSNNNDTYLPYFKEVEISAGAGRAVELDNEGRKLKFSSKSLQRLGVKPEHAACMTVWGSSMEPVIPDGATIAIDTSYTDIKDGEIYALDHDGMARVKILYRLPGGGIRLRSFNADEYPDERYHGEDVNKIRVIGFVFWYAVTRKKF